MTKYPSELNADLGRFYRVSLDDLHSGRVSASTVADYAAHMPRGGALGQAMGGFMYFTAEEDALWSVEHAIVLSSWAAAGGKGKQPQRRAYPEGTAAEEKKRRQVINRAKAFKASRSKT